MTPSDSSAVSSRDSAESSPGAKRVSRTFLSSSPVPSSTSTPLDRAPVPHGDSHRVRYPTAPRPAPPPVRLTPADRSPDQTVSGADRFPLEPTLATVEETLTFSFVLCCCFVFQQLTSVNTPDKCVGSRKFRQGWRTGSGGWVWRDGTGGRRTV